MSTHIISFAKKHKEKKIKDNSEYQKIFKAHDLFSIIHEFLKVHTKKMILVQAKFRIFTKQEPTQKIIDELIQLPALYGQILRKTNNKEKTVSLLQNRFNELLKKEYENCKEINIEYLLSILNELVIALELALKSKNEIFDKYLLEELPMQFYQLTHFTKTTKHKNKFSDEDAIDLIILRMDIETKKRA